MKTSMVIIIINLLKNYVASGIMGNSIHTKQMTKIKTDFTNKQNNMYDTFKTVN